MACILVIDDDVDFCDTMHSLIQRMEHTFHAAHTLQEGLGLLETLPVDVVLLDVRLPDGNGLEALSKVRSGGSEPEVIILTGQGDPDGAELAISGGVWDYLLKPSSVKQTRLSLDRAIRYRMEKRAAREASVPLDLSAIVGASPAMRECYDLVAKAARSSSQVLITGETGTGKELFARTIHENSSRAGGHFVVVDCASITETLLESTLFGHKKGAFTGADTDRTGLVTLADGGTLFLDEVGDMPLSIQKSFLRVLQEKRFRPVGETREFTSDFRLMAATNRDLAAMAEKGTFRKDLLFRLWTISLKLPPLRCRGDADIKALSVSGIKRLCEEYGTPNKGFAPDFFDTLYRYDWPGNVRELFNVLEMAFIASGENKTLYAMDLPRDIRIKVARAAFGSQLSGEGYPETGTVRPVSLPAGSNGREDLLFPEGIPSLKIFKAQMEKRYLEALIRETAGNPQEIMRLSGLSKSHFYALLKKNNIQLK